jgi:hypothetical protein
MGLDMYLTKKLYVGGTYAFRNVSGVVRVKLATGQGNERVFDIPINQISQIELDVTSWRKANQIHGWFVTNVQDDEDDCKEYSVSIEMLEELRNDCQTILDAKKNNDENLNSLIEKLLPPQQGFFFGSSNIDDYYFNELQKTVDVINKELEEKDLEYYDYYYRSSW